MNPKYEVIFDLATHKKIANFSVARLLMMLAILLTTIFIRQEVLGSTTIATIYAVLGVSFLFALINATFWQATLKVKYFIPSQLLYDLLLTSYLVFLTGINDSIFLFLYLLNIVFSSIVFQLNGALAVACASGTIYGFIYYVNTNTDTYAAWYSLAHSELLFLLTALLCGQLMDELKKQKVLLVNQQKNISRLELLNDRLLNSIPVGLVLIDSHDYVQKLNNAAIALLGLDHPPEIRLKYYELIPSLKGILEAWPKMSEKQKFRFSFSYQGKSYSKYSLQVVPLSEMQQTTAAPSQHILVFQDVSKILELEKKLHFESKLAATGQLAAGIAHEIRNPLASISGSIEMLNTHLKITSEEDKKLMAISLREIRRLNRLITDFLEFAKPKPIETSEFLLFTAVEEVSDAIKTRIKDNLHFTIQNNISKDITVEADRERVKQVLFNLFINSVEAAKGPEIKIDISATHESENSILIDILDNGIGICEENAKRIFDPFFTTKKSGTGLGLATVAQILRSSRGDISLEPSKEGAHFRINLPSPNENHLASTGT